jgi:hypothetical protein
MLDPNKNRKITDMKKSILEQNKLLIAYIISMLSFSFSNAKSKTIEVSPFKEMIISPYIEVVFKQSDKESVVIEKINVEVDNDTAYLSGSRQNCR